MATSESRRLCVATHGTAVLLIGLAAGVGFSYAAATTGADSDLYRNWKFAHLEGLLNGILVLALAGVWTLVDNGSRYVRVGFWMLIIGAYCNAIGPWITALFIGHRVIQPQTALESFVVYGFYVPGVLPLLAVPLFLAGLLQRRQRETTQQ